MAITIKPALRKNPQDKAAAAKYYAQVVLAPEMKQKQSLETLLRFLLLTYHGAKICGHRDLSPDLNHNGTIEPCEYIKQCPCFCVSVEYGYLMKNDE